MIVRNFRPTSTSTPLTLMPDEIVSIAEASPPQTLTPPKARNKTARQKTTHAARRPSPDGVRAAGRKAQGQTRNHAALKALATKAENQALRAKTLYKAARKEARKAKVFLKATRKKAKQAWKAVQQLGKEPRKKRRGRRAQSSK